MPHVGEKKQKNDSIAELVETFLRLLKTEMIENLNISNDNTQQQQQTRITSNNSMIRYGNPLTY